MQTLQHLIPLGLMLALPLLPWAAGIDDEFVLETDPRTHMPLGELVEARGLLLDPRDLPEPVLPYLAAAAGLEGLEASLTALFGRSLGFAAERKHLPKRYAEFCRNQGELWEELVDELAARVDWEDPEALIAAAVYHDTGRRISESELRIVGPPRIRFVPLEPDEYARLASLQADVALFGTRMPAEPAERVMQACNAAMEAIDDPWFLHAMTRVLLLSMDSWNDDLLENSFDMTGEEFMDRCRRALREALVDPLFPELPENVADDGVWFLEGLVLAQGLEKNAEWSTPPELEEHNEVVHQPILWIQMEAGKSKKKPVKRVRLAMVAGGETHPLYAGKWPLP